MLLLTRYIYYEVYYISVAEVSGMCSNSGNVFVIDHTRLKLLREFRSARRGGGWKKVLVRGILVGKVEQNIK